MSKWWGKEAVFDCTQCEVSLVTDGEHIKNFARDLVQRIKMIPFGEPEAIHFGDDDKKGYTLVQKISTSLISGHFCDDTGNAYINVFSCKDFDLSTVEQAINDYFKPQRIRSNLLTRNA